MFEATKGKRLRAVPSSQVNTALLFTVENDDGDDEKA